MMDRVVKNVDDVDIQIDCAIEMLENARKKYLMGEDDLAYASLAMAEDFMFDLTDYIYPQDEKLRDDKRKRAIEWEALRVLKPYLKKRP